jgi:hypothetical protein
MNDATAQFGMQLGHSAVAAGQDYVQRNVHLVSSFTPPPNHVYIHSSVQCSPRPPSNITLTYRTRMSSTKSGLFFSPGHTSPGPVVCVVQSRARASGRVQGKTSTVPISTFLVRPFFPFHTNLTIHSNGNGHIHPSMRTARRSSEAIPHKSSFPSPPLLLILPLHRP